MCNLKCSDGIKAAEEECDTAGDTDGCVACKKVPGWDCTENVNYLSTCVEVCGNSVRTKSEDCDAGVDVGCVNCQQVLGYECTGSIGEKSSCPLIPDVCGDSKKSLN